MTESLERVPPVTTGSSVSVIKTQGNGRRTASDKKEK
jgi:hypothetical protein